MRAANAWLTITLLGACGGPDTIGDGSSGATRGRITIVPNVVAGSAGKSASGQSGGVGRIDSELRVGSPGAVNIKSLQYHIIGIQICQDVTRQGSGYSNASGCLLLYQGGGNPADYASYMVEQAQADTDPGHYVDLMTEAGRAKLHKPVTLELPLPPPPPDGGELADGSDDDKGDGGAPPTAAGTYRYGLINFFRPIKVTAEFPVVGEDKSYFRTRAVSAIHQSNAMGGPFLSESVEIGDTLAGPTEETVYMLNNGGALFTFQKPFEITRDDLLAGREIRMDLVFNPESFGQAFESQGDCKGAPNVTICDPKNNVVIDMPYVRMSPVPRKAGEKTRKETYLLDYDESAKLRVELYYNDGDPEAGVQGVDAAVVYTSAPRGPTFNAVASDFLSQQGSVLSKDAVVTLEDWQHAPSLTGLARRQDGTATLACDFVAGPCQQPGKPIDVKYTYVGDSLVSSD